LIAVGAGSAAQSIPNGDKVIVTLAATLINILFLIRPFWYYRERNRSVINA
jgi:hypothetical protein